MTANKKLWLEGRHRITVDYFDDQGGALIYLGWRLAVPSTTQIGTNLSDWRDWSTEQPFIDLFKTSRAWIPQAEGVWDTGEQAKLDLDQNGWVRSLPEANDPTTKYRSVTTILVVGSDLDSFRPGGEYIVLYDGEGRIDYKLGTSRNTTKSSPGRDVVNVISNNFSGIQITIAITDPNHTGNYIRNIGWFHPVRFVMMICLRIVRPILIRPASALLAAAWNPLSVRAYFIHCF